MATTEPSVTASTTAPVISVTDAGIRFKRNRRASRSFKDLFGRGQRRRKADEFWALRNVSFDVRPGEAIGVVGRNGQGKSTLLKLVAQVMLPDEGRVHVGAGVAPSSRSPAGSSGTSPSATTSS